MFLVARQQIVARVRIPRGQCNLTNTTRHTYWYPQDRPAMLQVHLTVTAKQMRFENSSKERVLGGDVREAHSALLQFCLVSIDNGELIGYNEVIEWKPRWGHKRVISATKASR